MLPLGKHNVGEDSYFSLFGYEYNVKYVMFWKKKKIALKKENMFPSTGFVSRCEGCFCNNATRRAEGDHDVDLSFKRG